MGTKFEVFGVNEGHLSTNLCYIETQRVTYANDKIWFKADQDGCVLIKNTSNTVYLAINCSKFNKIRCLYL
jgi:hypothetical protein